MNGQFILFRAMHIDEYNQMLKSKCLAYRSKSKFFSQSLFWILERVQDGSFCNLSSNHYSIVVEFTFQLRDKCAFDILNNFEYMLHRSRANIPFSHEIVDERIKTLARLNGKHSIDIGGRYVNMVERYREHRAR